MVPSHQSNKATSNSDSNGHSQHDTTTITSQSPQLASQQQQQGFNQLRSLEQDAENLVTGGQQSVEYEQVPRRRWGKLSLRTKATAMALALGTLPVLGIGAMYYYLTDKEIIENAVNQENIRVSYIANELDRFTLGRYKDIQKLSQLSILNDPSVRTVTSTQEKLAVLNQYRNTEGYKSIAVADISGKVLLQSVGGDTPKNFSKVDYFKEVLRTNRPVISKPRKSVVTGKYAIFVAAPIVDKVTGKTIGMVRTLTYVENLNQILETQAKQLAQLAGNTEGVESYKGFVTNEQGKIVLAREANYIDKDTSSIFPNAVSQLKAAGNISTVQDINQLDGKKYIVSYAPAGNIEGLAGLNWGAMIVQPTEDAFAAQRQLLLTLLFGTAVTALVVGAIAAYLADRATRPILAASSAVEKLGQGELDTRIAVAGKDELATLGSNINLMADQLRKRERAFLENQQAQAEQARFFTNIGFLRVQDSQDLDSAFNKALKGARKILNADRVVIYRFNSDWSGYIAAESVVSGWPTALADKIEDPCIGENLIQAYRKGRVVPTNNVFEAGFHPDHLKLMERLQVKANLVTPILKDDQLFALLIAHHCESPHAWQQSEINFLRQLASHLGVILERVAFLEQQKAGKEQLQKRALELLMEVDPVSRGDLTIRANVTEDEIGTVADSYNATIGNLRKIVTQVQAAAKQLATTTSTSEGSVQELSAEALRQTEEISDALDRIQEMSNSIRAVAKSAEQAEAAVKQANQTVEAGDVAMNRTVEGILAIRETVTEASTKVKRLGEASQKISKVVNLISSFADQTNLLALNAAIEAARAGEEGRGFAVVADEVGALALKSAEATAEIESLVSEIQTETNEVVAAMEAGTLQVAEGTKLVDETRLSLNQITAVSAQIGALVQAIAQASVAQTQASEEVSQTMSGVAAIASQTSKEATFVSMSFKELLEVAQDLQASAGRFKVS